MLTLAAGGGHGGRRGQTLGSPRCEVGRKRHLPKLNFSGVVPSCGTEQGSIRNVFNWKKNGNFGFRAGVDFGPQLSL